MTEPRKLSNEELLHINKLRQWITPTNPNDVDVIGLLLGHIAAMEAEGRGWASRAAKDAFEVGHANANFIEQQTARIQTLEGLLRRTLQPLSDADYDEDTSKLITEIEQALGVEPS